MADRRLQAVAETRALAEGIDALLSEEERNAVIVDIATHPEGGDLIPESGGIAQASHSAPRAGQARRRAGDHALSRAAVSSLCDIRVCQERTCRSFARTEADALAAGWRYQGASPQEGQTMKKDRFDQLVASLGEVRSHVATGRFAGRISQIDVGADDIRAVRERSGMTQRQFADTFGIGLGTLQKWERGERRPSGAARSLLLVMRADLAAVMRALDTASARRKRHARPARRAA